MPTIGQLPPASSVSDSDQIAIFQNQQTLNATRAQFLAGTQTSLAVPQNTLLGGVGPGTTAPVAITVGANLAISGTTLSATATPFVISTLPGGHAPAASDIVPISQSGSNVGVSYANFLSGIGSVPNVPGGALVVTATGATTPRTLAALASNAVSIEDYGAVGDGRTDDSAALVAAVASGNPVRFGAKTYAIVGECDLTGNSIALLGSPGLTTLTRTAQSKLGSSPAASWISIGSATAMIDGIIFDGNSAITSGTFGAVAVQTSCLKSQITRCVFRNVANGSGLAFIASDPTVTQHHVDACEFYGNGSQGLFAQGMDAMSVTNCRAHDNASSGIQIDSEDPSFHTKIRELHVVGNTCWNNASCGIIVGNFNTTNTSNVVFGNANPDVLAAVVAANNCFSNTEYGIYISGRNILVTGNLCTNNSSIASSGAGILCDTGYCKVSGNMISGASAFGIDCGGSIYTEVSDNYINGALIGLNIGGGQNCMARANFIQDCTGTGIAVQNVESNGSGINFNLACTDLSLIGNWINYSGGSFVAILIRDAAQNVLVAENVVLANPGANITNALSAYTDSVVLRDNLLNFTPRWPTNPASVSGAYTLTFPDLVDTVSISQSSAPITKMITLQGALTAGQVTFAKVTNGGSGYTSANVSFSGTGSGAAAIAYISNGSIIGIQMTSNGSGYGAGTTVTISGNGSGATATVQVGLPVLQNRQLTVDCLVPVIFADAGSSPAQSNWTNAPVTIPTGTSIDWLGSNGGWRAIRFTQSDYVSPNGDGSLTLRTQSGDIALHPAGTGAVRLLSDTESTGAVELIGRGSPLNVVSAPPGSTFRNLNGGVGSTFWVKQSGSSATNWVAVA